LHICAAYVVGTWIYDSFKCFPYLHIQGQPGHGKSRLKDLLLRLVFLGVPHSGSSTVSTLFRITNQIRGTVVSDENDILTKNKNDETSNVYKQGFETGNPVHRTNQNRDGQYITERFSVFCPKIITTIDPIFDAALASRCIKLYLEYQPEHGKPIQLPKEIDGGALELRNKLLKYRFDYLSNTQPLSFDIEGDYDNRTKQVFAPLFSFVPKNIKPVLTEYLDKHKAAIKADKADSINGRIIEIINGATDSKVYCKYISEKLRNGFEGQSKEITAKKVGVIIEQDLKLEKDRDANGVYIMPTDSNRERILELVDQYGLAS